MREKLLEILVEPGTQARLELRGVRAKDGRIQAGDLVSATSGKSYPIIRGIPRFVDRENYTDSFGMQWNRFREVQLDSATGKAHSRQRFDAEAGWTADQLQGKWLLDAGCGAGRFAEVAAARGANLVALDYSSAVDAAAQTLASFANADLVQGSLLEPPFRPGVFDFAYCIGVVQHTPDPNAAIRNVIACLKPAGRFCFSIYARQPWTPFNGKYLARLLTRRLSPATLLRVIERTMPVLFPVTDRLFRLPLVGKLARFAIPVATYVDRDDFSREQRYQEAILDTFDMLSPRYDSPMTWREVEAALGHAAARSWEFRTRVPVIVVGEAGNPHPPAGSAAGSPAITRQ